MGDGDSIRGRAEQAFQRFLEQTDELGEAQAEAFVAQQDSELRDELRSILNDYRTLQEELGGLSPGLEPGRILGDYRLIEEIGRGGMGVIWEAEQLSIPRRVALKLLQAPAALSTQSLVRFRREAEAGGRLAHPGIVAIYAAGELEGHPFIAQELIPGGFTLADHLAERREARELPAEHYREVAILFALVADALGAAHGMGVIHRDVKPSNVLIAPDGRPVVADFGLAKIEAELSLSRSRQLMGTPYYMSPEQARGARVDARSDVFSLGAALYEALTMRRPFEGDTTEQVLERIREASPSDPRRLRSRVPRELAVICTKALEERPEHRFGSMAEFAADLRRFLADEPILARPTGSARRTVKWMRRHPVWSVGLGVGSAALVVVSALLLALLRADEARRRSERSANVHRIARALTAGAGSIDRDRVQAELDRCPEELRGWAWRYIDYTIDRSTASIEVRPGEQVGHVIHLEVGSDGETALVTTTEGDHLLVDLVSKVVVGSYGEASFPWSLAAFGGDGRRVFAPVPDSPGRVPSSAAGIAAFDGGPGSPAAWILETEVDDLSVLAASPDGELLVTGRRRSGSVDVWDLGTGERIRSVEAHSARLRDVAFDPAGQWFATASRDGTVVVWDRADLSAPGKILMTVPGDVYALAVAPDGVQLAAGGRDSKIYLWDTASWSPGPVPTLKGHSGPVRALDYSPGGELLVSASVDRRIHLWDVHSGEIVHTYQGHGDAVTAVAFTAGGRQVVSGSPDGTLKLWDVPEREGLLSRCAAGPIVLVPGTSLLVTGTGDWTPDRPGGGEARMAFWDLEKAALVDVPPLPVESSLHHWRSGLKALACSPTGRPVAAACQRGRIGLYDPDTREWIRVLEARRLGDGTPLEPNALAFGPRGRRLAVGWTDGALGVWDVDGEHWVFGPEPGSAERAHGGSVETVAFSPGGETLVSCTPIQRELRTWDATTGELHQELDGLAGYGAAWSPDGELLLAGSREGLIYAWDAESGELEAAFGDHGGLVQALVFDSSGTLLFSGSTDATVQVWDTASWTAFLTLRHDGPVHDLAFDAGGERLLAASQRDVRVWEASPRSELVPPDSLAGEFELARELVRDYPAAEDLEDALLADDRTAEVDAAALRALAQLLGARDGLGLHQRAAEIAVRQDQTREEYEAALRMAEAAEVIQPPDERCSAVRGLLHHRLDRDEEARQLLDSAVTQGPECHRVAAAFRLAQVLQELGEEEEARRFLGIASSLPLTGVGLHRPNQEILAAVATEARGLVERVARVGEAVEATAPIREGEDGR